MTVRSVPTNPVLVTIPVVHCMRGHTRLVPADEPCSGVLALDAQAVRQSADPVLTCPVCGLEQRVAARVRVQREGAA